MLLLLHAYCVHFNVKLVMIIAHVKFVAKDIRNKYYIWCKVWKMQYSMINVSHAQLIVKLV